MQLSVRTNFDPLYKWLSDLEREQLPFAASVAMTRTAQAARTNVIAEMKRVFDRPKPSTVRDSNSGPLRIKSASRAKFPRDYAEVAVKDQPPVRGDAALAYLSHHIHGGGRIEKRSEFLLRRAGILPPGYYAVPGAGARMDRFGNMSAGQVQQILSAFKAQRDVLQNTRRRGSGVTDRRGKDHSRNLGQLDYFLAIRNRTKTSHLAEGVWQRYGRNQWQVRPVLMFVRGVPRYRKRLRFYETCERTARMQFPVALNAAMERALATARVQPNPMARAA